MVIIFGPGAMPRWIRHSAVFIQATERTVRIVQKHLVRYIYIFFFLFPYKTQSQPNQDSWEFKNNNNNNNKKIK